MKELKAKIEAVLFCSQEGITNKDLAKACGVGSVGHIKTAVSQLQKDYQDRSSGLKIVNKGTLWFLAVVDNHLDLVRETARPDMPKAVLETLAYIAHKKDIRQADVIRIRSNKAYEHIKELQEKGFIEAKKDGSTKRLVPSKKFFDYFNLKEGEELEVEEDQ